jgi:hypothetical protein
VNLDIISFRGLVVFVFGVVCVTMPKTCVPLVFVISAVVFCVVFVDIFVSPLGCQFDGVEYSLNLFINGPYLSLRWATCDGSCWQFSHPCPVDSQIQQNTGQIHVE